jgi:hypothetical protein
MLWYLCGANCGIYARLKTKIRLQPFILEWFSGFFGELWCLCVDNFLNPQGYQQAAQAIIGNPQA